jgi:hypothetical protein
MKARFLTLLLATLASPALADPIYIPPGQCIMVGTQQVCAQVSNATTTPLKADVMYVCRFGMFADSETPELKSFELIQIRVTDQGQKVETNLKNFGINGKDACEKDLAAKG